MWRKVSKDEEEGFLKSAIDFTGNHHLYGSFMQRIIVEWPIACEQNLTDQSINRKAWVGHAAACLGIDCPEYITRAAWGRLTDEQRVLANRQAQHAIDQWEAHYVSNPTDQLCLKFF